MKIRARDILELVNILLVIPVVLCVPRTHWWRVSEGYAKLNLLLRRRASKRNIDRIETILASGPLPASPQLIEHQRVTGEYFDRLLIIGQYRYADWHPPLRLIGDEHLTNAAKSDRAVILWANDCAGSRLLTKMALHEAGFDVAHLSRPTHGFLRTEFGAKILNRYWTRIEDRYLGERIMLATGDHKPAIERLRSCLKEGKIVSITVGPWAKRLAEFPFFAGQLFIATGPVALAIKYDAALLPVFVHRNIDGGFEVRISPPIVISERNSEDVVIKEAAGVLAAEIEAYVAKYPAQWRGFFGVKPRQASENTEID